MPESPESQTLLFLVCTCAGLLVILIFMLIKISSRLSRIESRLASRKTPETPEAAPSFAPSFAETSPGGAFESFLEEYPARREIPKKEQFAAYRQWRQERGLNWSASQEKQSY